MSAALRNWRWCLFSFSAFVAGFLGGWYSLVFIIRPTDSDFLRITTSAYLKHVTEKAVQAHISYADCHLEDPSETERGRGFVAKHGVCQYEIGGLQQMFSVALSPTANIEWYE